MNNLTNERLQKIQSMPFHQYLGISGLESQDGNGTLTFTVDEHSANPMGNLHGGIVYALSDVCAYTGLASLLAPDQDAVTIDIHVSMLRPGKKGDMVRMESSVIKMGKNLCFIDVITMAGDTIIARARITKSIISTEQGA